MALVSVIITRMLEARLEFDEVALTDMVADAAMLALNTDLEEQGLTFRVTRDDLKVVLLANDYGEVQGAEVSVKKEVE